MPHSYGPQSLSHSQRLNIAREIAERMKVRFHTDLFAIALYGSLARDQDGPYSDIGIFGVLLTAHYKQRYDGVQRNGRQKWIFRGNKRYAIWQHGSMSVGR